MKRFMGRIRTSLLFTFAREIGWARWLILTRNGRRLPKYVPEVLNLDNTGALDYSRDSFAKYRPFRRTESPLLVLAAAPGPKANDSRRLLKGNLLILGPRFEDELLFAEGLGWEKSQIFALDLLAYSPRVTIGDMHDMPFSDGFFTAISCGWTLSYSREPLRAMQELDRVCAPEGIICFGIDVVSQESTEGLSNILSGLDRIQSVGAVRELLPEYSLIAQFVPEVYGQLVVALQKPSMPSRTVN